MCIRDSYSPIARAVGAKPFNEMVRYSFRAALRKKIRDQLTEKAGGKALGEVMAKRGIKELGEAELKKIRKEVAAQTAFRSAAELWAPTGAAYMGLFDLFHQDFEMDIDPKKSDFDYKRLALSTLAGAGFGGALGYLFPRVGERLTRSKFIRDALDDNPAAALDENRGSPELWGLNEEEAELAAIADLPEGQGTDEVIEVAEQIIQSTVKGGKEIIVHTCLLYTSPSPRD